MPEADGQNIYIIYAYIKRNMQRNSQTSVLIRGQEISFYPYTSPKTDRRTDIRNYKVARYLKLWMNNV